MDTYYLVDYENVGSKAFTNCKNMQVTDHIIVFFSINAKNIDMRMIADIGKASLTFIEVTPGKQSLDLHLASYLGYLIGKHESCNIKIISKDTDYDKVINFWKNKKTISVGRYVAINNIKKRTKITSTQIDPKTKLNNALQDALKHQNIVPIAEAVTMIMFATEKFKSTKKVYDHIVKQYGRRRGLEIYSLTKNIIKDTLK